MWIQVRSMDGKTSHRIDGLSKLTKVEDLRGKLEELFDAPPNRQRLFYRGKQLEDDHSLFDYSVGLNEIVQILIRPEAPTESPRKKVPTKDVSSMETANSADESDESSSSNKENEPIPETIETQSGAVEENSTYKLGDIIDCRDGTMGAWFEARIIKITESTKSESKAGTKSPEETSDKENINTENTDSNALNDCNGNVLDEPKEVENVDQKETVTKKAIDIDEGLRKEDRFIYHILYAGYDDDPPVLVSVRNLRPRARKLLPFDEIQIGDTVMVNYNYDEPKKRGYWYDAIVTYKHSTRTIKNLTCTVHIGADLVPMQNCTILFWSEVFATEKAGSQLNVNDPGADDDTPVKRTNKPECDHCLDNPQRKCKHCACSVCGGKNDEEKTLLCDECDNAYHIFCLDPPLESIPDVDEWYCPLCKNDASEVVMAGEKLKESKKRGKMASAKQSGRDWGRGMACVGRTKMCNIVPPNHFGAIPGIEVGTAWKFRVQVSEAGVHRPHVAGIHGREEQGAYSIVLAAGYDDDLDEGEEFKYTGSGGRDLSGNKRTAEQSCDQTLNRMNLALAKNCNAPINNKKGASATDWQAGKPVRVVRNCKGRAHSRYAPEEGNRYDGIYKIVKYWPEKGKSGFLVWRYLMRRDDPVPAPWTKKGKKRIHDLGLTIQYPEGYLENQAEKAKQKAETKTKGKGRGKRKRDESDEEEVTSLPAKKKTAAHKLDPEVESLVKEDEANKKLWDDAMQNLDQGSQKFLAQVEEIFRCICCQDVVLKPVTIVCGHNICQSCLQRSFRAEVYNCPACRHELGKDYSMKSNSTLASVLLKLFPGYDNGR